MKFIRVNMAERTVKVEKVPKEYLDLGGRALTSLFINAEVPANCDPLGPENTLILAPGILSGTSLVNTSRLSIGAKSPLTGGIKESNTGGRIADALGRLGITALIIEGKPVHGELYLLRIDERGEIHLRPAQTYQGMRTYTLVEKLLGAYGRKNGILCIGPAGEFQLASASIQSTDVDNHPCRAAGRGGLGAVMGAKGVKAIIVDHSARKAAVPADPDTFKNAAKVFAKAVKDHHLTGEVLAKFGTAVNVSIFNGTGAFPCYNATKGVFESWEKISGERLSELIVKRGGQIGHKGCSQCIIRCSNVFVDHQGQYVTSSLEYETIWSTGGMCGIDDLDAIARLDFLCDDIGVDTMNTGVAVAVAMDAGYKPFGDAQAAIDMVEEIAKGSELGKVFGNGPVAVGEYFDHHRVPVAKKQSIAGYDPRAIQGMAVTYSTSPMGADHTAGYVVFADLDPLQPDGQVELSRNAQINTAWYDFTGLCQFTGAVFRSVPEAGEALIQIINAKLGTHFTREDMLALGRRVLQAEREFNRKAGLTAKDDRLADMFYQEPLPPHNKTVLICDEDLDRTFDVLNDSQNPIGEKNNA